MLRWHFSGWVLTLPPKARGHKSLGVERYAYYLVCGNGIKCVYAYVQAHQNVYIKYVQNFVYLSTVEKTQCENKLTEIKRELLTSLLLSHDTRKRRGFYMQKKGMTVVEEWEYTGDSTPQ